MKGTDKNCSASSEGLKEVTPGHSDQKAQRPVELGGKAVPLTGAVRAETRAPRRCTAMGKEMPGASHHTVRIMVTELTGFAGQR